MKTELNKAQSQTLNSFKKHKLALATSLLQRLQAPCLN
jgi:hypothetical protein